MDETRFINEFNIVKDIVNFGLAILTIFIQVYGLFLVIRQLQTAEKVHADTLEWNRRKSTDEVLEVKPDRAVTEKLNELFNTSESNDPVLLEKIEKYTNLIFSKSDKYKNLKLDIQHLLNVYERLARGMKNEIYVEEMIKDGLRNTFIKVYNNYSLYIQDHREKVNERAWIDFEYYVRKWTKEKEEEENN